MGVANHSRLALLPRALSHPLIHLCCWSVFMRGEYDTAVLQAFLEVEGAIRAMGILCR